MKRLALSIIGGVVIPFLLAITLGPLSTYTHNPTLRWLLDVPTGWPRLLYFRLFPLYHRDSFVENEMAFLLFIIGSDILFYGCLTYFLLLVWKFSKKPVESAPPPPPRFQNDEIK